MAFPSRRIAWVPVLSLGMALGALSADARAGLQLSFSSGSDSLIVNAQGDPGEIIYSNGIVNNFIIKSIDATSNSGSTGPGVVSQLGIDSFSVKNNSDSEQVLTISVSDVGFKPDDSIRPLMVFNSASGTFSGPPNQASGTLSFQTFAYDGSAYFQTTGPDTVSTDPVVLTPSSSGSSTMAYFTPTQSTTFSLTNVMTIDLAAHASISGFSGLSIVHAPEPGTFAVALSGVPILVVALWRRRLRAAI